MSSARYVVVFFTGEGVAAGIGVGVGVAPGFATLMEQVDRLPPLAAVAAIVTLPALRVVTKPVEETVAALRLLVVQRTSLLEAFWGSTVALSCSVSPAVSDVVYLFSATATGTMGLMVVVVASLTDFFEDE
jgi:methyl coenzyme M reductase subunit C